MPIPGVSGFERITTAARKYGQDAAHQCLAKEIIITQPGYMYIYLNNDSVALGGPVVDGGGERKENYLWKVLAWGRGAPRQHAEEVYLQYYYPILRTYGSSEGQVIRFWIKR